MTTPRRNLFLVAATLAVATSLAHAGFYNWNNPAGGAYETAANWSTVPATGTPPGAGDVSTFSLNQPTAYTMTLTSLNRSNHQIILSPDKVIFDLYDDGNSTSYTYTQTFGGTGLGLRLLGASELTLNGGKLVSAAPGIGGVDGDNAKLFVTGSNAVFESSGALVGWAQSSVTSATGRVEILNGATWTHNGVPDVYIGFGGGGSAIGTGILVVNGSTYTSTSTGRLIVGNSSNSVGTATFQNGSTATLSAALVAGFSGNSSGTVNLTGSTTSLTTTSLDIATSTTSGGNGFLNVTNAADAITSGSGGLNIGHSGTGKYGKVVVDGVGSTISAASLDMGFTTTSTGELEITNGGVVTIRSGTGSIRVGVQAAAVGNVLVQGNATDVSRLDINSTATVLMGGGGSGVASGTITIGNNGVVNQFAGSVNVGVNSLLEFTGGTLTIAPTKSLNNAGTIEGTGTISRNGASGTFTLTNAKTLQPGSSTTGGLLTITNGALSQTTASGVLELLLGDSSTMTYGRIAMTGANATVTNGSLDFALLPSFTPAANTVYVYDLLTAPTVTISAGILTAGRADAYAALYGTGGGAVTLQILGTAGSGQILRLTAVPEPAAAAGMALVGLLCIRRARHRSMC